jgi:GNAT superfamily N-acetyltransferase
MRIEIEQYSGESLPAGMGVLAEFRLQFFREFPYLYAGTEEGEREHMSEYIANPTARLLLAKDRDYAGKVVGVAMGTLLSTETEILCQIGGSLPKLGIVPERFYYFGEMIFDPEYRRRGIGKQMLEQLKSVGREQGADRFGFLAVVRERNDTRRPAEYVDSENIFQKFGFDKTDIYVSFEWSTIQGDGTWRQCPNQLALWIDRKDEANP